MGKLCKPRFSLAIVIIFCGAALSATAQTLSPGAVSFGNYVLLTTSIKTVTLTNTQATPLTISSISILGNFGQTSKCPSAPKTLAAGASCTISVSFTPTVLGTVSGTLSVSDNSSTSPHAAQLSGTGVYPAVLSPATAAFGTQLVNTSSTTRVFALANNQNVPLAITAISTTGDFPQTSNCPLSPNILAARLSCKINVTFAPSSLGARMGVLTVTDTVSNSPQTANLSGTGTAPVLLSPGSLTFASQVISTASKAKSISLKNSQAIPLTISGISASGDFAQTSNCPLPPNTLAAGASCTISVTFTPTTLGARTGTLTFADSASTSPQTVSLSGSGTLAGLVAISITPPNATLAAGGQQQFSATGNWASGVQSNITNFVTWTSSAPFVASVNSTGLAQAMAQGSAQIEASYGSVSRTATITVTPPALTAITVTPGNPSAPAGAYQQFTALLSYSDGSSKQTTTSVAWSSSLASVGTINSSGLVSALASGTTTITATSQSITGTTTLNVFQPQCVTPSPALIGWWTGDGNSVDLAANHSGMLLNGATYGNGEVGQAFSFAGNGASLLVGSPVYSQPAGTLMFWFFPTSSGRLTGSYDGTNHTPGLSVDSGGNLYWEFGNLSAQLAGQVPFNQWSHVALTYSVSNSQVNVQVYLNGSLVSSALATPLSSWYPQVAFGAYLGAIQASFAGSMDEIAIFNQALSAPQVQQIYDAFSAGICKPTLQSITLTPATPSLADGLSQQFDAAGNYNDGSAHDLTTSATWSSSNPAVVTINGGGQATAVAVGNATITAALGAQTGSDVLSVVPTLVSLQVNPQAPSIAAGTTQPFTATGTFGDGTTQDLTPSVTWSSSQAAVATVAPGGLANGISPGQATITASAGSIVSSSLLTVTPAILTAITIIPQSPNIPAGTTQAFTATGSYSDGTAQNLTNSVTWKSSTPAVATIDGSGLATSSSAGQTTIAATSGSVTSSVVMTVTSAALTGIVVNPANPSLLVGSTQQFTATGTYGDNSTQDLTGAVTWSSSNPVVAGVSAGLASALTAGPTAITATLGSVSGSTTLTVILQPPTLLSISVAPANPSVTIGQNLQFAATGQYSDGSTQNLTTSVTWISSQPSVAAISAAGVASGLSGGSSAITAAFGSISASVMLNVSPLVPTSIALTPVNPSIALGTSQQLAAIGTFADGSTLDLTNSVTWSSSSNSVATVNPNGLAISASTGQTLITAAIAGISGSATVTVTPAALVSIAIAPAIPTIPLGTTVQLAATGTFTDGSTQDITTSVQWNSSNGSIATVSNTNGSVGIATSVATGNSTISATSGSISASVTLTVGIAALVSITVGPASPSIALGTTQQFFATGTFTDGSTQDLTASATWASANTGLATISSSALATSMATGTTAISATLGSIVGSTPLTVTSAALVSITVNPASASTPLGLNQAFNASGIFTDGSTQDVTSSTHWSSLVPTVATISNTPGNNGIATSTGAGTTVITATSGSVAGTANLTVTIAILAAIQVTPQSPSIPIGATEQFTAIGVYTDGTAANITTNTNWASSPARVATISNASGSQGTATGVGQGTSAISAALGPLTGSTTLIIQEPLVSVNIAPLNSSLLPGSDLQFTAMGTYLDGTTQDLTNTVTWSSSSIAVASINASGLAMSIAPGQTTVSATSGSLVASTGLTVADLLGTGNGSTVSCPTGLINGATCYSVTISCPNVSDFTGYVKVNYPNGTPLGTAIFSTGGSGNLLYENSFNYGTTALNTVLKGGFTIAQVSWGSPFANQPNGWQTGPGGIRAVACRYATIARWIYTNIHLANTMSPFCATGNSAGGEEIGLALSHYGLGSIFAMVEPTGGPPFSRQDWACDCSHRAPANSCGGGAGYCVGPANAGNFIDTAYSGPLCSQETTTNTTTSDAIFLQDSIMAPDAVLSYPTTFVKFLYGGKDSSSAPNQGQLWQSAITTSNASACIADAPHGLPDVLDGAQQIASDILTYCKLAGK